MNESKISILYSFLSFYLMTDLIIEADKERTKDTTIEHLKCPISHEIFYDPVLAMDGNVYERRLIECWLKEKQVSPINGLEMETKLVTCIPIRKIVTVLLENYPRLKDKQYKPDMTYQTNKKEISEFMLTRRYDKLMNYHTFDLADMLTCKKELGETSLFHILVKNANDDIIKHVLDNSIDVDVGIKIDPNLPHKHGTRALHIVCEYSNINVLDHILKKGVDRNSPILKVATPIKLLCEKQNFDCIKLLLNYDDIELEGLETVYPLLIVCQFNTYESIMFLLSRVKNINVVDGNGMNLVDHVLNNTKINKDQRKEILMEVLNKGFGNVLVNYFVKL